MTFASAGGTTPDVGMLVKGLPRPGAATVYNAGVRTNFAMPDLHSIGMRLPIPGPQITYVRD